MRLLERVLAGFGPEDWEHKAVVEYCDARGIAVFHVPNSTWTKSPMVRLRNTILGVRAGIPDLWVVLPGIGLLVIEMKQTGRSETSAAQKAWISMLDNVPGVEARVCKGAAVAVAFIEEFVPLRGRSPALPDVAVSKKRPEPAVPADDLLF